MFVALRPSEDAVADLDAFWEPRRTADAGLRWTPPEQWHLTLAFLPAVPDRLVEDLADALAGAAGRRTPFGLRVAGGGAFPDVLAAKVLWAGVADPGSAAPGPPEELDRLAVGVRAAASHVGAAPDGGRFRPHLTLARCGRPAQVGRWVGVLDTYAGPAWSVEDVLLVASWLGEGRRGRPRHEVLATLPLGGG